MKSFLHLILESVPVCEKCVAGLRKALDSNTEIDRFVQKPPNNQN